MYLRDIGTLGELCAHFVYKGPFDLHTINSVSA